MKKVEVGHDQQANAMKYLLWIYARAVVVEGLQYNYAKKR